MHLPSSTSRITSAVCTLQSLLDAEIRALIEATQSTGTLSGPEASKAIHFACECAGLRATLQGYFQNRIPALIPAEMQALSVPKLPLRPKPEKVALSREEAAEVLGVSIISIDRLVKRGLLRPSLALRRPLFTHEELNRFMRETSRSAWTR